VRKPSAVLGSVVFLFVAPGVVAGWIPYALSGWQVGPPVLGLGYTRLLGGILIAAGLACLLESFARTVPA